MVIVRVLLLSVLGQVNRYIGSRQLVHYCAFPSTSVAFSFCFLHFLGLGSRCAPESSSTELFRYR